MVPCYCPFNKFNLLVPYSLFPATKNKKTQKVYLPDTLQTAVKALTPVKRVLKRISGFPGLDY
jgi:hypothetical protein